MDGRWKVTVTWKGDDLSDITSGGQVKAGDHYMTLDLNPSNNNYRKTQKPWLHLGAVAMLNTGAAPRN